MYRYPNMSESSKKFIQEIQKQPWQEAWDAFVESAPTFHEKYKQDMADEREEMHRLLGVC